MSHIPFNYKNGLIHDIYYSDTDQLPAVYSSITTILWKYMVYKPYTSHIPFNYKNGLIYNIGGRRLSNEIKLPFS